MVAVMEELPWPKRPADRTNTRNIHSFCPGSLFGQGSIIATFSLNAQINLRLL